MMNKTELYKKLLEDYGYAQVIVAIEELSELQKELCKALRYKLNEINLIEEIADVEIMLEQMKLYYEIDEEQLEKVKQYKLERTKQRLGL